jgi:lysophospholipase L1-like esterase
MKPSQDVSSYGHSVHINSMGLRGPEPGKEKYGNRMRILFIGDSVTFGGTRIREEELFVRQAEKRLTAKGNRQMQAINIAAPGWSPQNWIEYINYRGLDDADVVVLTLPECDLGRPFSTLKTFGFTENAPLFRVQSVVGYLYNAYLHPVAPAGPIGTEMDFRKNVSAVSRLLELARGLNIPVIVVFIPSVPPSAHAPLWPRFSVLVDDPLDLREQLRNEKYFMDGVHLNPSGHAFVGDVIAGEIDSRISGSIAK